MLDLVTENHPVSGHLWPKADFPGPFRILSLHGSHQPDGQESQLANLLLHLAGTPSMMVSVVSGTRSVSDFSKSSMLFPLVPWSFQASLSL